MNRSALLLFGFGCNARGLCVASLFFGGGQESEVETSSKEMLHSVITFTQCSIKLPNDAESDTSEDDSSN